MPFPCDYWSVTQQEHPRTCLFCGDSLTRIRSQEHVFPQWLLDELKIRDEQVSAVHLFRPPNGDSEPQVLNTRTLALEKVREGRVCTRCNNGWMSDMEQGCRETLLGLIRGQRLPEQLTEQECLPVARWATKTAYVLNSSSNYTIKVPPQHLRELCENTRKLPWGVVVAAAKGPFVNSGWFQSTQWQLGAPDHLTSQIERLMESRTYKIGVHFGHMLLMVIWHSIPDWWKMFWSGHHTVLWPWRGKCGWHDDDPAFLARIGAEMTLAVHVNNEVRLVHHRYLTRATMKARS